MARGIRVYLPANSRFWKADLRKYGLGRTALRNPQDPGWPAQGRKTELREVAEAWSWAYYALVQEKERRDAFGLGPLPEDLRTAAQRYLRMRSATVEHSTWTGDRTAVGHLLQVMPSGSTTAHVTSAVILDLFHGLLERGYRPTTLRTYAASLAGFLDSIDRAHLIRNLPLPKPGELDVLTFGPESMKRLRMAAERVDEEQAGSPSARYALELGLSMGLRRGEIFALAWEDIRPEMRSARIQRQVAPDSSESKPLKGKLGRTVLVLPGWWEIHTGGLGYICGRAGKLVSTRTQRNLIARILDTAGLNAMGLGWHVLRHTYARQCLEDYGVSMEELQRFLGHASIMTTERRYGHFRPTVALERAAKKVYGGSNV